MVLMQKLKKISSCNRILCKPQSMFFCRSKKGIVFCQVYIHITNHYLKDWTINCTRISSEVKMRYAKISKVTTNFISCENFRSFRTWNASTNSLNLTK